MGKGTSYKQALGSNLDNSSVQTSYVLIQVPAFCCGSDFLKRFDLEISGRNERWERENRCEVLGVYWKVKQTCFGIIFLKVQLCIVCPADSK